MNYETPAESVTRTARMGRACLILLLSLCTAQHPARALSPSDSTGDAAPLPSPSTIAHVTLGASSVALAGPWRFRTGDDMAWAQKDFDDSAWDTVDLTPPPGASDASLAMTGYLPGWTARGYEGYSGYAWYRLRVDVQGTNRKLSLKMPGQADDAYQVYVDGKLIGQFGKFTQNHVTAYSTLPEAFRLPAAVANQPFTIAVRMWMDSATPFNSPDAGGLHGPPVLGYASLIGALVQLDYDNTAHYIGSGLLEILILLMALLMTLALSWLDPHEKAYLWLALVCLVTLLGITIVLSVNFTPWIGQTAAVILGDVVFTPVRIGLWVLFWAYWFRIWNIGRVQRLVWEMVAILILGTAMLRPPWYGQQVPVHFAVYIVPLLLVVKLGLGVLLLSVAFRGFTRQRMEGGMAAAAILLVILANYQHELRVLHVKTAYSIVGFAISLGTISTTLSLLIITVMLLRRFFYAQRVKEQWKMEIQQARQVQQVLIPNELPQVPGLTIESEYRPAREVGGDFFQILPLATPGSVLIVVGDVTGKGMQAGMLVALIVGAIRAAVHHTSDPAQILHEVNEQLCERQQANATCLILRIDPDGKVKVANAGQLPPYINGKEFEMEGAFPIGIIPDSDSSIASFVLQPGDSVVLMSDGVVEAQDAHGSLFGFERIGELLRQHATPRQIAKAAQNFGQEDDILVLQVNRNT